MPHARVNGVSLFYEDTGEGDPIVFAHEFADDYRSWADQVSHFAQRYRCIAYNARGFAPSEAPTALDAYSLEHSVADMAGLMRNLGINHAHIVGLSMGSMTTLNFGLRHPEMARSLVVAGTGPGDTARAKACFEAEIVVFIADIETKGWARVAEDYGLTDDRLRLRDKNPAAYHAFQDRLAARQLDGPLQTLRRVVTGRPLLADLADELDSMAVPTLIATGDEDHVCIDTSLYLKRVLPVAGIRIFPKTGHAINLEEPERFNEMLDDFFAAVEGGRWHPTPAASRSVY
jgi:pimeloyl-ACP methyl ester carboxylesterase